eukprot:TRINITY_DN2772_c0_g1_i1.p1 TRINITY_DN2772_c0_g1~~TRINITY_DN2772_c0_g1_i1.p1  ORF type:complete len:130 (-),score=23.32 TRINITY_DN2772_c0_g1_i1:295-636(-)
MKQQTAKQVAKSSVAGTPSYLEEARSRISLRAQARWPQLRAEKGRAEVPADTPFQSSMHSWKLQVDSQTFMSRHAPLMPPIPQSPMASVRGVSSVRSLDSTLEVHENQIRDKF